MTDVAKQYFILYYKLERCYDEGCQDVEKMTALTEELRETYNKITDRERELLDIVGKSI